MSKETKFIIGAALVTLGVIVAATLLISKNDSKATPVANQEVLGVTPSPQNYDLGEIPINGGIVTREYEIKNTSGKDMNLAKITTSCMCTSANIKIGETETKFYSMEMTGDKNPLINIKLKKDESAKVTVRFDPAAHGPAGVGAFDRIVWLYFDEGFKELTFNGTVVK